MHSNILYSGRDDDFLKKESIVCCLGVLASITCLLANLVHHTFCVNLSNIF